MGVYNAVSLHHHPFQGYPRLHTEVNPPIRQYLPPFTQSSTSILPSVAMIPPSSYLMSLESQDTPLRVWLTLITVGPGFIHVVAWVGPFHD